MKIILIEAASGVLHMHLPGDDVSLCGQHTMTASLARRVGRAVHEIDEGQPFPAGRICAECVDGLNALALHAIALLRSRIEELATAEFEEARKHVGDGSFMHRVAEIEARRSERHSALDRVAEWLKGARHAT